MKIAWFSPRVPEHSDIANYTQRLEDELHRRFDVRFLAEQPAGFYEPAAEKLFHVTLGHTPPELLHSLNAVDVPIYNLGNNPTYFSKTWFLSQAKPGIVILHDLKLHHFFEGIYRERFGDQKQYLALMEEHYGAPGVEAGKLYWQQKILIDFMAEHFPMTAWAVRNALAVVVHTPYALEVAERETVLPVWLNALPYDAHISLGNQSADGGNGARYRGKFSPERPARLVIFGYLNSNRRVIEFLQALAAMPERASFEVEIFGELWQVYDAEAKRAVDTLGLHGRVTFHGYVTEEELDAGLARSDLAINLRFPTMGEASGSQLRIWDHALPSLVTQIGGYATMPEEAVSFVRPDHEHADIQRHLRDFLARPEAYWLQGEAGRRLLLREHLPSTYVERLQLLCERVTELRSRQTRLSMATRVGRAIAPWADVSQTTTSEFEYAKHLAETF